MIDANQAEVENGLASIDRVVSSTQFGQYKLLDGTNAAKTITNEDGSISTQEGLRFHVGPNADHMASTSIRDMSTNQLGRAQVPEGELPNKSNFMSLADIDVRDEQGAQDALAIIDQSLTEVATVRGELGAFQRNNLESNLNYLRIAHENAVSSESVIRDADIAEEMAKFTRDQIMVEASTSMLAQANQNSMAVLKLLQ